MNERRMRLRDIPPRGVISVPLAACGPGARADVKPLGTVVRRAEPLASTSSGGPAARAPIAGLIGEITELMLASGRQTLAVTLQPLSEDHKAPAAPPADGPARLRELLQTASPPDLPRYLDHLREAGVWADRWASPDLFGQLRQCLKRPIDTVVCSTLDFDDALPLQQTVAGEYAIEIVAAVALLAAATGATRAVLVVDPRLDDSYARSLQESLQESQTGVRIFPVRNDYPQPNPTLLLYSLARRQLRPGALPTEAGVLLLDAVAAALVGRCLLFDEPALQVPVGIADMRSGDVLERAGSDPSRTHLLRAPIGMSIADVLREAGVGPGSFELRGSSPLREVRLAPDRCVISAGGEAALYLVSPAPSPNPDPCIRCGWCVSGCPVHIHPAGILEAAQARDAVVAERHGIEACIECGICSYLCPSHLPLLGGIRSLRSASV